MVTQSKFDYHKHLVWIAHRCNIGPRRRVNLHVGLLQSCRELLPTASPWLLDDCTRSGRPIDIGVPLSNRPRRLGPYHMVGCQGRVAHTYWALMTNITVAPSVTPLCNDSSQSSYSTTHRCSPVTRDSFADIPVRIMTSLDDAIPGPQGCRTPVRQIYSKSKMSNIKGRDGRSTSLY